MKWDLTSVTVSGSNTYAKFNSSTSTYWYAQKTIPSLTSNYDSQGFIHEFDNSNAWALSNNIFDVGVVSAIIDVYIANITKKMYIYWEGPTQGNRYWRAFWFGVQNGNTAFVEINTAYPIRADTVETQTASLTYTLCWNRFGVYSDNTGTYIYNVMYDGSTSQTGKITHSVQFTDDSKYLTCIGGRLTSTTTSQDSCSWIFHDVYLYNDKINLADVQALSSFSWNNPWPVCPSSIAPACSETVTKAYVAKGKPHIEIKI